MVQAAEDHLPAYRVRPRFEVEIPCTVNDMTGKILSGLKKENAPCKGRVYETYATLYLPEEEQHFWSPQLSISVEETETGCLLRGLYGPRPTVWTMFVFFYSLIGFAALVVLIIGLSYLSLDQSAHILWWVPVLALVFLTLYLVAFLGQRVGHDQMVTLHRFVEDCTGITIL